MNTEKRFWEIECSKHLVTIFKKRVDTKYLTEKNLKEFIRILVSKYALSDDEILEQQLRIPFKKTKEYIEVRRKNNELGTPLAIYITAQVSDISVIVSLVQ